MDISDKTWFHFGGVLYLLYKDYFYEGLEVVEDIDISPPFQFDDCIEKPLRLSQKMTFVLNVYNWVCVKGEEIPLSEDNLNIALSILNDQIKVLRNINFPEVLSEKDFTEINRFNSAFLIFYLNTLKVHCAELVYLDLVDRKTEPERTKRRQAFLSLSNEEKRKQLRAMYEEELYNINKKKNKPN